jgi:2-polyprenyl-6-methoxyphenol hydroxylase-like FAD-dependent oxidoreductase
MKIGIVGAGISGLHLALRLQAAGVQSTLYTPRSAQEMRESRLPNTVARFWSTRERERELGVDHWPDWQWGHVDFSVAGTPLGFTGRFAQPPSSVDFRIYLPALLEDYEARGGDVVVAPASAASIDDWSQRHELMVLAAGGREAAGLLPRDAARSPFDGPQRRLCAGVFRGLAPADPVGLTYVVVPGVGEIFGMPFLSLEGPVHSLLIEAVPGGPLEALTTVSYDDDPAAFDDAVVAALGEFAAPLAQRVQRSKFGLTRSLDLLQGAVTPTVREPYRDLASGRWLIGVGDAWVINDPVVGQGANLGSRAAWILAEAIVEEHVYDELFCRTAAQRMWEAAEPVTNFSNAFLTPPPPHVLELLAAASQDQRIADELANGFERPDLMWRRIATPQRAAAMLAPHGVPASPSRG